MIRFALIVVLFALPASLLGYILLLIYPHIPQGLFVILCAGILCGIAYRYWKKQKMIYENANTHPDQVPQWISKVGYKILFVIGTLIGTFASYSFNKTSLYMDNGSENAVTVDLKHEGKFTIAPHSSTHCTVVIGENEVSYNGKKRILDISGDGKWLWNIDSINYYIRTSISYSSETKLYKSKKDIPEEPMPDFKIMKGEFFNANVDYMFDAPKSISVKKTESINDVKKTVLYRIGNDEMTDNDEENGNGDSSSIPEVKVKSSRKK